MLDLDGIDSKLKSMTSSPEKKFMKNSELNVLSNANQIGQGTFGKVYKSQYMTSEGNVIVVALKKILLSKDNEGFPRTALKEIKFLKRFNHPNILKLIDITSITSKGKAKVYLVFEYMAHDLSALVDSKIKFTLPEIKCLMHQVLTGINFLHSNNIIHRDIKSPNILLNNEGQVKIGDFGLAREINQNPHIQKVYTNQVVTLWYRAPELILGEISYGMNIDMWSVGCLFAELIIGQPPFIGSNEKEQIGNIFKVCGTPNIDECLSNPLIFKYPELIPRTNYDDSLRFFIDSQLKLHDNPEIDDCTFDLLNRMLQVVPSKRITARDALNHKFFNSHSPPMCMPAQIRKIERDSHSFQFRQGFKSMIEKAKDKRNNITDLNLGNHPYENPYYYSKYSKKKGRIIESSFNIDYYQNNPFDNQNNSDFQKEKENTSSPNILQSLLYN